MRLEQEQKALKRVRQKEHSVITDMLGQDDYIRRKCHCWIVGLWSGVFRMFRNVDFNLRYMTKGQTCK